MAPDEVTVTTTPTEDPSVLAEAAVASVGVSAVAAVKAADAVETADEAQRTADLALDVATSTPAGVSAEEARRIAREEYDLARNAETAAAPVVEAPTAVAVVENVPAEVAPPSVEKANPDGGDGGKKLTLADRWHGKS